MCLRFKIYIPAFCNIARISLFSGQCKRLGRRLVYYKYMRGHDRQNPVSNSDVANLNSVVPNCCFIRTEFERAQQNLRLQDRI